MSTSALSKLKVRVEHKHGSLVGEPKQIALTLKTLIFEALPELVGLNQTVI